MKTKLLFLLLLLSLPVALSATAVRSRLVGADGLPIYGATIEADLQGCTDNNGPAILIGHAGTEVQRHKVFKPGTDGRVVDTIIGNDAILCGGKPNTTWWTITTKLGANAVTVKEYRITGGNWDFDDIVRFPPLYMTPSAVVINAIVDESAGDQTINQENGSKLILNGIFEVNGSIHTSGMYYGNVTGNLTGNVSGSITGNAVTATQLAADPADCTGNTWARGIDATGAANCQQLGFSNLSEQISLSQIPTIPNTSLANSAVVINTGNGLTGGATIPLGGSITLDTAQDIRATATPTFAGVIANTFTGNLAGNAATATALAGTPAACAGSNWLKGITAAGVTTCTQPGFSNISGSVAAGQMPAFSGDGTTPAGSTVFTLNSTGITAGTYTKITVDAKGRATAGATAASSDLSDSATLVRNNADQTITGTVTATGFIGPLAGNASTATALAADPTECSGNNWAKGVNASGAAQCAQPASSNLSDSTSLVRTTRTVNGHELSADVTVTAADLGLANAELTSNKGQANGYASLDANGKIPNAQLPPLAITQTFVVSSEAQMLALDAMTGDIAVRSDLNKSFILSTMDSTVLTNWQELLTPPSSVLSVNGKTGVVSLASTDLSDTANIVFPSSTHTLTNKTYNAESTGNVLTVPFKQYSQAAGCESTNPYTMLDVPASNYPSPVCLTGTNIQKGGLRFTNAGNQTAQLTFYVPSDQTGTYDYRLMTLPATTVASTWQLSYACAAAGATDDAAFTAYTAITITATGANYFTVGSQTGQTGCSAGKMMHLKIARTDTTGPATIDLLGFEVTLRRAM